MFPLRKEVAFAHDEHLDGEEEQREGVDIEQRVRVANLQQVRQFEQLQQVDDTHGLLRRKELMEMLAVGLRFIEPLQ